MSFDLPAVMEHYVIKHLTSNVTYQVWIAASTTVGVGLLSGSLTVHLSKCWNFFLFSC